MIKYGVTNGVKYVEESIEGHNTFYCDHIDDAKLWKRRKPAERIAKRTSGYLIEVEEMRIVYE